MKTLQQHIYENIFHKSEINEKLIINKNFKPMILCKSRQHLLDIIEQRLRENSKELYLSDIDTSEIDDMSNLFERSLVKKLDLSSWDVSNVKYMSGMFAECVNLEYIDISGWEPKSLESMLSMFYDCSSLKEIKGIEDLDMSNLMDRASHGNDGFGFDAFFNVNEKLIPNWWHNRYNQV